MDSLRPVLVACALALAWYPGAAAAMTPADTAADRVVRVITPACAPWDAATARRDPTPEQLRCRHGIKGSGRFGLSWFMDVPVYQPETPMPGTHVVGVPGLPAPRGGESYEAWEWRLLGTVFTASERRAERGLEVLDPLFAERLLRLERLLAENGFSANRRETWRSPQRQAFLFQQGRSRSGALATTTLTSWHSVVDASGRPAGRAADYQVPARQRAAFHELVAAVGLESYGADSNDSGHVFWVPDALATEELILLRILPRVPVVTLATGRPVDERPTPVQLANYREAARAFPSEPLLDPPPPGIVGYSEVRLTWITRAAPLLLPPAAVEPRPAPRGLLDRLFGSKRGGR